MNTPTDIPRIVDQAWQERDQITPQTGGDVREAVHLAMEKLDHGELSITEKDASGVWFVHEWLKKAVLLSFRLNPMHRFEGGPHQTGTQTSWFDKVPLKFQGWRDGEFTQAGFRAVPGALVRHSAYIAPDVVLMPSFVNVGAHVGRGTMVDSWATIGSCARVGAGCHISGGVGIGGVLEPLQARPVIIEDRCFIGARSEIAEGVVVEEGAVISMGVFIGASTKIVDRTTGEIFQGRIPAYAVVVPGTLPAAETAETAAAPVPSLACAVIVKRVDARTREKTGINDILRQIA